MPTYGYVWLAAHPINLFITCTGCNRNKGSYFPLDPAGGVLKWGEIPPGAELPLLIDPSREDPSEHIRFAPAGNNWWVVPRNSSRLGKVTIQLLELNCSQLRRSYKSHVKHCVKPHVRRIRRNIEANDKAKLKTAWTRAVRELFAQEVPFQLLSHDVLDQTFSASERAVLGLSLPKPSAAVSPSRG